MNNRVIELNTRPSLTGYGSCAGKTESEGPISQDFDICFTNDGMNQSSWEKAECELLSNAVGIALKTANKSFGDIDVAFAGDLLNQCIGTGYGLRNTGVPHLGLYGACSTMAESLLLAAVLVDGGYADTAAAVTPSSVAISSWVTFFAFRRSRIVLPRFICNSSVMCFRTGSLTV